MIIKGEKRSRNFRSSLPVLFLLGLLILLTALKTDFWGAFAKKETKSNAVIFCDAETVKGDRFINNGFEFNNGHTQSKEKVYKGNYSCKLDKKNKTGFSFTIPNPQPGTTYKAEVFAYNQHPVTYYLAAKGHREDFDDFFTQVNKSVSTNGDWWSKYELIFTLPNQHPVKELIVYVYKEDGENSVFFDNFKITKITNFAPKSKIAFVPQQLKVQVDIDGLQQLDQVRKKAYAKGILEQSADSEIKAKIIEENKTYTAKLRYKGDWLDHLMSGSPSYRIKLKSNDSWNRLQTFSVQHPKTRGYLREWVYHNFLNRADVLSPRYDFISFKMNEDQSKVMAMEEHFTKNLVEYQLRREGPIIKFTEDRFWEGMSRTMSTRRTLADPDNKESAFWTSEIKPFKEAKTSKSPALHAAFEIAQDLLFQYKHNKKNVSEVFDIDRLAKFIVVTDICRAYHALTWHNQRFYYNPVTGLLEPIGYDGHGEEAHFPNLTTPTYAETVYTQKPFSTEPLDRIFYDKEFMAHYIKYLYQYTQVDSIKSYLSQIQEAINLRESFVRAAKKDYKYNDQELIDRALKISENILPFGNSLQVFKEKITGDSVLLKFYNAHKLPLEIVGIGKKKLSNNKPIGAGTMIYPQRQDIAPKYLEFTTSNWVSHVHFRLPGLDSIYTKAIPNWTAPGSWSPRQELLASLEKPIDKIYQEENDIISFTRDNYLITKPLIIPKGKSVVIHPGTKMNFSGSGFFLSFSPVQLLGDPESPIIIQSTDGQSGSFTIMQANGYSKFRNVIFEGQNTMSYKGWNLTGGVTLYESDVQFINCQFNNNQCEDALNIVRSTFKVENCSFSNIFGDAFDADFSQGDIINGQYHQIGNDALDFSTCSIQIDGCKMVQIGDKAISVGEQAKVTAKNIAVDRANIGFASKDLSVFKISDVTIMNSNKGFVAYQKKPEYGPAKIILGAHKITNVKNAFMIEAESVLEK